MSSMVANRPAKSRYHDIYERAANPSARVNWDLGVIHDVHVLGPTSLNNRTWTRPAMEQIGRMAEGARVNIDHPSRNAPTEDRKVADRFGKLQNIRVDESGVWGDLVCIKSHPLAPMVFEVARTDSRLLGLSVNATGRSERRDGHDYVIEAGSLASVDLVADPGAVSGMFESQRRRRGWRFPVNADECRRRLFEGEPVGVGDDLGEPVGGDDDTADDGPEVLAAIRGIVSGSGSPDDKLASIRKALNMEAATEPVPASSSTTTTTPAEESIADAARRLVGRLPESEVRAAVRRLIVR